jgi:drug/metabolite transporter (DMT)-like permease
MGWGLLGMMAGLTGALIISWELQKVDQLMGYTVGVASMFVIALLGVDYMARRMK